MNTVTEPPPRRPAAVHGLVKNVIGINIQTGRFSSFGCEHIEVHTCFCRAEITSVKSLQLFPESYHMPGVFVRNREVANR